MSDSDDQNKSLKTILDFGLSIQSVAVIVEFCAKNNKLDFLKKLNELITTLVGSLTEEEKTRLQKDMDSMLEKKAGEFVNELGSSGLSSEEMDKAIDGLKSAVSDN